MSVTPHPSAAIFGALFSHYQLDAAFDEMFERTGQARPSCLALYEDLCRGCRATRSRRSEMTMRVNSRNKGESWPES